jgi:hypothetical protein
MIIEEIIKTIGEDKKAAVEIINQLNVHYDIVWEIDGIKQACGWLDHERREISSRNNKFYDSRTNELIAIVNLPKKNGNTKK